MREEIQRITKSVYFNHESSRQATKRILALFADKVRGIEQSDIKGINPGEYDSSTVALCDGFEAFRTAILKELE